MKNNFHKRTFFLLLIVLLSATFTTPMQAQKTITPALIFNAETLFDLHMSSAERDSMLSMLESQLADYKRIHNQTIDNGVPLAIWFNPVPAGVVYTATQKAIDWKLPSDVEMPKDINKLAWYSVADLSVLIRTRKISSVELTRFFLARLKKYSDTLHCVITFTEKQALK
jgi:hypothetical protein